ncbi:hypothetical protein [Soonwooa sp.]|nr:hypothetical protein [Soonwooa sp.]
MESNQFPYSTTLESAFTFGGLFSFFGAYYFRNFGSYYRYYWYS